MYEMIHRLRGFSYKLPLLSAYLAVSDINCCDNADFEVPHAHHFGEIYCGLQGTAVINVNGMERVLTEGNLLYVGPSAIHHCVFNPLAHCSFFVLSFKLECRSDLEGVKQEYIEDEEVLLKNMLSHSCLHTQDFCGCRNEVDMLCRELANGRMGGLVKIRNYVANFFISAIQSFSKINKRSDFEELIQSEGILNKAVRIADYMWRNCAQDLTIKSVARALNYSPRHVQRIISDYFCISFFELLIQYRLGQAENMLRYTDDSLELVGERAGFRNAQGLRRCFKAHLSITPSEYRRKAHSSALPRISPLDLSK